MKKLLFFVVSSVIVFAATVFFRLGAYKTVVVEIKEYPALNILFAQKIGPYNEIEKDLEQIEGWAGQHHLACSRTFGEFLDDPRTTDDRRLRSHVGCVLDSPLTSEQQKDPILRSEMNGHYTF